MISCDEFDPYSIHKKYVFAGSPVGFVYFLFNGEELVYIGQTCKELAQRIKAHMYDNDKVFNMYGACIVDKFGLDSVEKYFISKYKPKYNRLIPANNNINVSGITIFDYSVFDLNERCFNRHIEAIEKTNTEK